MTDQKPRILIVDDEPINLRVLSELLKDSYALVVAKDGKQALARLEQRPLPDLCLLDVMMPEFDGVALCRKMKADPSLCEIPVIFVTAMGQPVDEAAGFDAGGVDYITKPISPPVVLARIRTHIALVQAHASLRGQNQELERRVAERTEELGRTRDVSIRALASLAETRDNETGNHIRRTQGYVRALAERVARAPEHRDRLTPSVIDLLFKSAPLHDIGKVGIPDAVLLKPGKLTPDEFDVMKRHTVLGRDAILAAEQGESLGASSFLHVAREIAYGHHEKWDGTGYPLGLRAEAIPLSSRLMAVADVYDALISKRPYKVPFSHEKACEIILEGAGKHFDPALIEAFTGLRDDFDAIACAYRDE